MRWTDLGLLWLRVLAGLAMAWHGSQKVFIGGTMEQMIAGVGTMGFPAPAVFAWAAALSEFAGGLCLALGLWTRWAALFIFITMSVAFFIAHRNDPFQVKELAYLFWAIAGMFIMAGPGAYTVKQVIKRA